MSMELDRLSTTGLGEAVDLVATARATKRRVQGLSATMGNFDGLVGPGMAGWRARPAGSAGRIRLHFGPHFIAGSTAHTERQDVAELGSELGFAIPLKIIEEKLKALDAQGHSEPQAFQVFADEDRPLPGPKGAIEPAKFIGAAATACAINLLGAAYHQEDEA